MFGQIDSMIRDVITELKRDYFGTPTIFVLTSYGYHLLLNFQNAFDDQPLERLNSHMLYFHFSNVRMNIFTNEGFSFSLIDGNVYLSKERKMLH